MDGLWMQLLCLAGRSYCWYIRVRVPGWVSSPHRIELNRRGRSGTTSQEDPRSQEHMHAITTLPCPLLFHLLNLETWMELPARNHERSYSLGSTELTFTASSLWNLNRFIRP